MPKKNFPRDVPFWTGFQYKNKDFLELARPKVSNCKNICCKNWRQCISREECIVVSNIWDPIRNNLTQENIKEGCVVTLDCFFYPPNLLNAGLVAADRGNKVVIWYLTGKVVTVEKSVVFKFPDHSRVYQLRAFIVRKQRRIRKQKKEKNKLTKRIEEPNKKSDKDSEIIAIG